MKKITLKSTILAFVLAVAAAPSYACEVNNSWNDTDSLNSQTLSHMADTYNEE